MVDINVTLVWLLLAAGCSLVQAARAIKKKFPATPPLLPPLPLGNFISQNDLTINNCQAEHVTDEWQPLIVCLLVIQDHLEQFSTIFLFQNLIFAVQSISEDPTLTPVALAVRRQLIYY